MPLFSNWPYQYVPSAPEGKELLQLAVFSRYPIREQSLITHILTLRIAACGVTSKIPGRTIRLFNNHLQTTEVTRNKRKLEKELYKEDTQKAERAALTLIDGLHENFRKRAGQADVLKQLIADSPILPSFAATSTLYRLLMSITP